MEGKSLIFQRVLLNYFHPDNQDAFLKNLSKEDSKALLGLSVAAVDPRLALLAPERKLSNIHYSWFIPLFKGFSEPMKPLILSILPQSVALGLCKYFKITYTPFSVSPAIQYYFLKDINQKIDPDFVLPVAFLPPSPLNLLADLSKEGLVELIDFIALYDLAEEMRHIVDQRNLKNLYNCLSPKKMQFLRICLHQKVKFLFPKLELDNWMADCRKLAEILHRQGLYRLGTALAGRHPDLIWHINHILDTGRAAMLAKICSENPAPDAAGAITQQVLNTINFLKKKSNP